MNAVLAFVGAFSVIVQLRGLIVCSSNVDVKQDTGDTGGHTLANGHGLHAAVTGHIQTWLGSRLHNCGNNDDASKKLFFGEDPWVPRPRVCNQYYRKDFLSWKESIWLDLSNFVNEKYFTSTGGNYDIFFIVKFYEVVKVSFLTFDSL